MTPSRIKRGSYLGPSLASCFLISGLSYKTAFNSPDAGYRPQLYFPFRESRVPPDPLPSRTVKTLRLRSPCR